MADLVAIQRAEGTRRVAVRAALTMGTALIALLAVDRVDWSIYATFGAFASIYGGGRPTPGRWRIQAGLGALLTTAVASGALIGTSELRSWIAIPVAAGWATLGAVLSDRQGWRPPGPIFLVFAAATCAAIPTDPAQVAAAVAVAAATATFAVGLGAIEGRCWPGAGWGPDRGPMPPAPRHRQRLHAIRCAVAVAAAGLIATTAGISHPYWAMIAAVVPLTVRTLRAQLVRGAHRAIGTAIGLAVAAGLLLAPFPTLVTVAVIAALQACAELLVIRNYGLALIAITPLALLCMQLAHPQPVGPLLVDRLVETLIGVAVGVLTAIVTRDRTETLA